MKNQSSPIVNLRRSQLHPHPDNPRKDLGDLTELKESIRANGIMQNLLVIPQDEDFKNFTILIGHRRFAASEGVTDILPCVIVENLSPEEQVGIMLTENLQRNDLTIIEQAHGFQMMMDLGTDINTIANKTGFSKKTIKHRCEIAKLPADLIKKAQDKWQMSISDLIELEKVKDVKKREEILSTSNNANSLKWNIDMAVENQIVEKNLAISRNSLKSCGIPENTKVNYYDNDYRDLISVDLKKTAFVQAKTVEMLKEQYKGREIFWQKNPYRPELVLRIKTIESEKAEDETPEETSERQRLEALLRANEERKQKLKDAFHRISELEFSFIDSQLTDDRVTHPGLKWADQMDVVKSVWTLISDSENFFEFYDNDGLLDFAGENGPYREDFSFAADMMKNYDKYPFIKKMIIQVWVWLAGERYYDWQFVQHVGLSRDRITFEEDILGPFGFILPDDLDEILHGISDLFNPGDDDD